MRHTVSIITTFRQMEIIGSQHTRKIVCNANVCRFEYLFRKSLLSTRPPPAAMEFVTHAALTHLKC